MQRKLADLDTAEFCWCWFEMHLRVVVRSVEARIVSLSVQEKKNIFRIRTRMVCVIICGRPRDGRRICAIVSKVSMPLR